MEVQPDFRDPFVLFNAHRVEYVIVGSKEAVFFFEYQDVISGKIAANATNPYTMLNTRAFSDQIRSFYEQYDEASRLTTDFKLEFARTQEILMRYLPSPPAVILDIGGGPGVYACWLAGLGYEVHLIDPVPSHVEQARQASERQPEQPIASAEVGDARDLAFSDGFADVVLMLGPLYHLTERADRLTALREARRVLKDGGLMVSAFISRFASLMDGFFRNMFDDAVFVDIVQQDLRDGRHRNPTDDLAYFTDAYLHLVDEIETEIVEAGLAYEQTLAVEGPGWLLPDFDAWWEDEDRRRRLLDLLRSVEQERSMLGVSAHLLGIARK